MTFWGKIYAEEPRTRGGPHTRKKNEVSLFEHTISIWGAKPGDDDAPPLEIKSGVKKFQFAYKLLGNDEMPTSLEYRASYIRYGVAVKLLFPNWSIIKNPESIASFKVVGIVDCDHPEFRDPITKESGDRFGVFGYFRDVGLLKSKRHLHQVKHILLVKHFL